MYGQSRAKLALPRLEATETVGAALAHALPREAESSALYLYGELGVGKTACVRSLLQALGIVRAIKSPTYTLMEIYEIAACTCLHLDLYRLAGPLDLECLGLRDYWHRSLMLVEWPERAGAALPAPDMQLRLGYAQEGRLAEIEPASPIGERWLANLLKDTSLTPYLHNLT